MHLDAGAVQRKNVKPHRKYLMLLKCGKNTIKHARFRPPAHSGVNRVSVAEVGRQAAGVRLVGLVGLAAAEGGLDEPFRRQRIDNTYFEVRLMQGMRRPNICTLVH
jgi:hypothetical protein